MQGDAIDIITLGPTLVLNSVEGRTELRLMKKLRVGCKQTG